MKEGQIFRSAERVKRVLKPGQVVAGLVFGQDERIQICSPVMDRNNCLEIVMGHISFGLNTYMLITKETGDCQGGKHISLCQICQAAQKT
ncbi:hypothetical protein HGA64_01625 [Candidatus Falkowbacteria bacterium]|nr:hypothetical protein [Candidatus Falkowbacteria bacterium]